MTPRILPAMVLVSVVAGCAGDVGDMGGPAGPVLPEEDTCGAAPYAGLIGQDATALETVLILGPVRVIRPDTAVTLDFRQDRLNFDIDGQGRIARLWCG